MAANSEVSTADFRGSRDYRIHHLYSFFCAQIAGLDVLDISPDAGRAAGLLAAAANHIHTLTPDASSALDAQSRFAEVGRVNIMVGSPEAIPLPSAAVDVIVAAETEILTAGALAELKRVLRPNGLVFLSARADEARAQDNAAVGLRGAFANTAVLNLRMVVASSLSPGGGASQLNAPDYRAYTLLNHTEIAPGVARMDRIDDLVLIASDGPTPYLSGSDSIFLTRDRDLWRDLQTSADRGASERTREIEALQGRIADLEREQAAGARLIEKLSARPEQSDFTHLAPLMQAISDKPVDANLGGLIALLSSTSVRLSVQALQIDQTAETLANAEATRAHAADLNQQVQELQARLSSLTGDAREGASQLDAAKAELEKQAVEIRALRQAHDEKEAEAALLRDRMRARRTLQEQTRPTIAPPPTSASPVPAPVTASAPSPAAAPLAPKSPAATTPFLASISDPRLRTRAADLQTLATETAFDAANTVHHSTPAKPSISLTMTLPRATPKHRARLARLLGRSEVRLDNRALVKTLFDESHYLSRNNVQLKPRQRPLDHYITEGRRKGFSPHPMIDRAWYDGHRSPSTPADFDLLAYLTSPARFGDVVHPLFDADRYLEQSPDVRAAGVNPLAHYLLYGWLERRSPNALFDSAWYLSANPDVLESGMNPLVHYVRFGADEGRQPHFLFDRAYYLRQNPDVGAAGMDAYVHYIAFGQFEGRFPSELIEEIGRNTGATPGAVVKNLLPPAETEPPPGESWQTESSLDFALPEALRRFILDQFGPGRMALYRYLMSVISKFSDQPESFPDSPECEALILRARELSTRAGGEAVESPEASIIVPAFNNLLYTLTAIVSVLETAGATTFEIIVADDASTDATPDAIVRVGGVVRLARAEVNAGFLLNCNAAAQIARGRILIFLNNDVLVLPGWLDALVAPMANGEVGMTGSRLLSADGRLQEAGGVFWNDGSAWNFGRDNDAALPEYNYLKDVDYVSGASIAIDHDLWRRLGGFDPVFSPAYCEDADIAFRIRQEGLRTVYQPFSTVIHHEGRSHGRDLSSGVKAYQVINQAKFVDRWKDVLARENLPPGQEVFLARDRSRGKPHVLIIDHYIPQWNRDAGSRTLYLYIRMFLDQGFSVTFWPDNLRNDREYGDVLRQMGVEVIAHPIWADRFPDWMRENGRFIDHVLVCRPHVAEKYVDAVRAASQAKILYYGVDLHHMRLQAAHALSGDPAVLAEARRWEEIERRVCQRCDVVMYPGQHEVEVVSTWVPDSVAVIDFPISIFSPEEIEAARAGQAETGSASPYDLMFVGGFTHGPNVSGIQWFVTEVLPLLRQVDPRFNVKIAGSNAPQSVMSLAGPGVTFLGRISDEELDELYRTSGLSVVPLLFGAGVKGKVVEAMSKGVPVVMTSVGAQGLTGSEAFAFVEDDARAMAEAILGVARDPSEANRRAGLALDFIRSRFSTEAVKGLLAPFIPELSTPTERR